MPKIIVKSTTERFRRAGIEFNRHGVEIDTDDLSEAQLKAIKSEPRLAFAPPKSDADADGDDTKTGDKKKDGKK